MKKQKLVKIDDLSSKQIASICDHTLLFPAEFYLKKGVSSVRKERKEFANFLKESIKLKPYAVCVRPQRVYDAWDNLERYGIKIASVVGFPDGSLDLVRHKISETQRALNQGAHEIDMVINYDKLKAQDTSYVEHEVGVLADMAHNRGALLKLILETSELNQYQITKACEIATRSGVDFIKTSTGFGVHGAREKDLILMKQNFKGGIKISGGVNPKNFKKLLCAASGRTDGKIDLDPMKIRIGESSLLSKL